MPACTIRYSPATADQAAAVVKALSTDQGIGSSLKKGTLLRSVAFTIGADALRLSFDMNGLGNSTTTDLTTYNSDVAEIRSYCG